MYCVDAKAHFAFFFNFSFCHSYIIHMVIFSVKDFSVRILKFGTKLDSDKLYCVTKIATYCLSVPLFIHFSFSPQISQLLLEPVFSNFVYTLGRQSVLCK